ncbi:MAG: hypothetical protein ACI4KN_09785 [Gemmiger sp.]
MSQWDRKKKDCLTAAFVIGMLLCGCGAQPLSQREIVRAVLFDSSADGLTAVLLISDEENEEEKLKAVAAQGNTAAEAWDNAEYALQGRAFYGLTDLVALPAECGWQEAQEIAALVEQTAQPAPEITVFALGHSYGKDEITVHAPELYEKMTSQKEKYGIQCGLQTIFSKKDLCAIPVYEDTGYAFAFLAKKDEKLECRQGAEAQMAAILTGQSNRMDCTLSEEKIHFQADVYTAVQPESADSVRVILTLSNCRLSELGEGKRPKEELGKELDRALTNAFTRLESELRLWEEDPLNFRFWVQNRFGKAGNVRANLTILREDAPET